MWLSMHHHLLMAFILQSRLRNSFDWANGELHYYIFPVLSSLRKQGQEGSRDTGEEILSDSQESTATWDRYVTSPLQMSVK